MLKFRDNDFWTWNFKHRICFRVQNCLMCQHWKLKIVLGLAQLKLSGYVEFKIVDTFYYDAFSVTGKILEGLVKIL